MKAEVAKRNDRHTETVKDISVENLKCKVCDNSLESKKALKMHLKSEHAQVVKCKSCEESFERKCDLEEHNAEKPEIKGNYSCDKCEKVFVLKWRRNKHRESHDKPSKKCHYFNNKKTCPFEKLGCMYEHTYSGPCTYGKKCSNKLCMFQHEIVESKSVKDLEELFDNFSDDEQYESRMVVCDYFCKADIGKHRCEDEEYEALIGLDAANIYDEYDSELINGEYKHTVFLPCEKCNRVFTEYEKVWEHFLRKHTKDEFIECIVENCEYAAKSVSQLTMHIGVNHYELVKIRL